MSGPLWSEPELQVTLDDEPSSLFKRFRGPLFTLAIFAAISASVLAAVQQREGTENRDAGEEVSIIAEGGSETDRSEEDAEDIGVESDGFLSGPAVPTETETTTPSDSATFGDSSEPTPLSAVATTVPQSSSSVETTTTTSPVETSGTTVGPTTVATVPTTPEPTTTTAQPTTVAPTTIAPTTALPTTVVVPPTTAAGPVWMMLHRYDFGPSGSAVKSGFSPIGARQSGHINFGGIVRATERATGSALNRDLVYASETVSFNHGIANGKYRVSVTMGDANYPHDEMTVRSEGVLFARGFSTAAGEFKTFVEVVNVADRELKVVFSDGGGADPNWVLTALTIEIDTSNEPVN